MPFRRGGHLPFLALVPGHQTSYLSLASGEYLNLIKYSTVGQPLATTLP
jgi:hypothetical protein